ncbi:MAG: ATP synthase F1 subunit epsilon [Patescibacteria group bacterium]|nr:MAG: ATP synthase F1 subunit epsilon [Patescibacteria group bacterium]
MKVLDFELTTPERVAVQAKVRQVSIPTTEGEITVLPDHLPLVAPIQAGELRVVNEDGSEMLLAVSGGFVTVHPGNRLAILADSAERADELDLKAIEEAKARAEELLKEKFDDEERYADAAAGLARELARLKVVRKHRSRSGMPHIQQ